VSIPIRNRNTPISSEVQGGYEVERLVKKLAKEAAKLSIDSSISLNEAIAQKAKGLNSLKIQRIVEEGNTVMFQMLYDKKKYSHDRRIKFPLASLDGVLTAMGDEAPELEVNPNIATGKKGEGEMKKVASLETSPNLLYRTTNKAKDRYEEYQEKIAKQEEKERLKKVAKAEKECDSLLFKIANSLVMTERRYKTANEVFNTLITDAELPDESVESLQKTASDVSETLSKRNYHASNFMVRLEHNPMNKVATRILGEHSLLKEAEDQLKTKPVQVQPTMDVADYNQLVNLARQLKAQQSFIANQPKVEVE